MYSSWKNHYSYITKKDNNSKCSKFFFCGLTSFAVVVVPLLTKKHHPKSVRRCMAAALAGRRNPGGPCAVACSAAGILASVASWCRDVDVATFGILLAMAGDVSFFLFWGWGGIGFRKIWNNLGCCLDDGMVVGEGCFWIFVFFFVVGLHLLCWDFLLQGKLKIFVWRDCNMALLLDFQVDDDRWRWHDPHPTGFFLFPEIHGATKARPGLGPWHL